MLIAEQIKNEQNQLKEAVSFALSLAKSKKIEAEISVGKSIGLSVGTRFAKTETIEFNNDGGLNITIFKDQKQGSVSTSDLSFSAIESAINSAIDIANYTAKDIYSGLADRHFLAFDAPDLDLFHPTELNVEKSLEFIANIEQCALDFDPKIKETDGANFSSLHHVYVLGNSHDFIQSYCSSRHSLSCSVIAEENGIKERDYYFNSVRELSDFKSPQEIGEICGKNTVSRLNSTQLQSIEAPVLFHSRISSSLFYHLINAMSGRNIEQKMSFLMNSLEKQIFPDWLNIFEKPHLKKGLGSAAFDSEGVKTYDSEIIKNGHLTQFLLGSYSARKLGMQTNGHSDGTYNWQIFGKKNRNFNEMLALMDRGLLVTEFLGRSVNIITGDYSRGVAGFWVENGQIQFPVSGITIAGNLKEMFMNIIEIGTDFELPRKMAFGSILIEKMKIAGK